jgi:hypothetical protein
MSPAMTGEGSMSKVTKRALVVAAALAVAACGGGGSGGSGSGMKSDAGATGAGGAAGSGAVGGPGGDCFSNVGSTTLVAGPPPTENNSADLRGLVLGGNAFDASAMRRMVPVTVTTALPGLQVGAAYLTRTSSTLENAYLTIAVSNTGTARPCFLQATPLHYLNGTQLLNDATHSSYVSGSVGDVGFGISTDSCLGPGESGYFIDIQLASSGPAFFSSTTSIELGLASDTAGTVPAGRLHPTGYEVGACSPMRSLRLTAVNDGSAAVEVAQSGTGLSPVILLDAGALPAGWLYLQNDTSSEVAAGATLLLNVMVTSVAAVDRARFFMEFDAASTTAALEAAPTPAALSSRVADVRAVRQALAARWRSAVGLTGR